MPFEDSVLYLLQPYSIPLYPPTHTFSIKFFPHVTLLTVSVADKSLISLSGQRKQESYSTFIYLSIFPFVYPHFHLPTLNKRKLQLPSCVFSQKVLGFPQTVS